MATFSIVVEYKVLTVSPFLYPSILPFSFGLGELRDLFFLKGGMGSVLFSSKMNGFTRCLKKQILIPRVLFSHSSSCQFYPFKWMIRLTAKR